MAENITITAEQVEQLISFHEMAEKRFDKAYGRGSDMAEIYRAEVCAIENVLDIIGIAY